MARELALKLTPLTATKRKQVLYYFMSYTCLNFEADHWAAAAFHLLYSQSVQPNCLRSTRSCLTCANSYNSCPSRIARCALFAAAFRVAAKQSRSFHRSNRRTSSRGDCLRRSPSSPIPRCVVQRQERFGTARECPSTGVPSLLGELKGIKHKLSETISR
jgi:hypothetical protein